MRNTGWIGKMMMVLVLAVLLAALYVSALGEGEVSLVLEPAEVTLSLGRSQRIVPRLDQAEKGTRAAYVWQSSDEAVATVFDGSVTGKGGGSARITCEATLPDGTVLQAEAQITVVVPVTGFRLTGGGNATVLPGETYQIETDIQPADASVKTIAWKSGDEGIARVDEKGLVTAAGPGTTTVTGTTVDGTNRSVRVTVYVPSMEAGTRSITVNDLNGVTEELKYYGGDFAENVNLQLNTGDHFTVVPEQSGDTVTLRFAPLSTGTGRVTLTDRKDTRSRVILEVSVESGAIAPSFGLLMDSGSVSLSRKGTILSKFRLTNVSGNPVIQVTYLADYRDADGKQICLTNAEGNLRSFRFIKTVKLKAGGKINMEDEIDASGGENVAEMRYAVAGYQLEDGTYVDIPDSQLYWYSTATGYGERPAVTAVYERPSSDVIQQAGSFMLGYDYLRVYSYVCEGYAGSEKPGEYVVAVEEDSLCRGFGLRSGDVIIGVDEMSWAEEPYATQIGKSRLLEGKTVVFRVMRYGKELELEAVKTD